MLPRLLFMTLVWGVFTNTAVQAMAELDVNASNWGDQVVRGQVIDVNTQLPIADALVSIQATDWKTYTDANGRFELNGVTGSQLTLVAAKRAYYYAAQPVTPPATDLRLALSAVASMDHPDYAIQSPQQCAVCHPRQYSEWTDTPMARAGFNTWVHDIYNGNGTPGGLGGFVYLRDSAHAGDNPASECAACHQPQGWLESPFSALDDDVTNPTASVMHGVSCEMCHKVTDVDVAKINYPGLFPGAMRFSRPAPGTQVQYGVLGDVAYSVDGTMQASYQPGLEAETCGLCHQDKNDPDGTHAFDGVTSEPTYVEWAESDYSNPLSPNYATCVDCHMPVTSSNEACSVVFPTPPRQPDQVRSHQILGTTPSYLENAVDLQLTARVRNGELVVNVTVANTQTGHHVPTGVTVRNMILLVEAWPQGGSPAADALPYSGTQTVHELGGVGDPAQGYYAGLPGKLYAKVNQDAAGNGPVFFTEAETIRFDSRIPALASDQTRYTFAVPADVDQVSVRARLIYRRAFRFLVDAKQWTEDGHGNPLADVASPHFGHLMEQYETVVNTRGQGATAIPLLPGGWQVLLGLLIASMALLRLRRPGRSRMAFRE